MRRIDGPGQELGQALERDREGEDEGHHGRLGDVRGIESPAAEKDANHHWAEDEQACRGRDREERDRGQVRREDPLEGLLVASRHGGICHRSPKFIHIYPCPSVVYFSF